MTNVWKLGQDMSANEFYNLPALFGAPAFRLKQVCEDMSKWFLHLLAQL